MNAYLKYREPFLPAFFSHVSSATGLSGRCRLLDIACGTGTVAFGFSPYVGSITGIDVDDDALQAARLEARRREIDFEFIHSAIEDFSHEGPPFDLVTIGRAHAYLPREAVIAKLEDLVSDQGKVLLCGTMTSDNLSGRWALAYRAVVRRWGERKALALPTWDEFMSDSGFVFEKRLVFRRAQHVPVEHLLGRALSYSKTASKLGNRQDEYLDEVRAALMPYAANGVLRETIETGGNIYRRIR